MDFDRLRADNPLLGFAIFAYEPGGPVIFEVKTPLGDHLPFTGATLQAAVALAFPYQPPAVAPAEVDMFE